MKDRICLALQRAGVENILQNPDSSLADSVMDSLIMAMAVVQLEQEFKIRIPASQVHDQVFENLTNLENFLKGFMPK